MSLLFRSRWLISREPTAPATLVVMSPPPLPRDEDEQLRLLLQMGPLEFVGGGPEATRHLRRQGERAPVCLRVRTTGVTHVVGLYVHRLSGLVNAGSFVAELLTKPQNGSKVTIRFTDHHPVDMSVQPAG